MSETAMTGTHINTHTHSDWVTNNDTVLANLNKRPNRGRVDDGAFSYDDIISYLEWIEGTTAE